MNSTALGKKIKEARIEKKMTQAEVVGDFITRNMLSQIESGNACPSVKTLEYLAKRLELPVNYLIPYGEMSELSTDSPMTNNSATVFDDDKLRIETLLTAKKLYLINSYQQAIDMILPYSDKNSIIFDECAAILARSYLELAQMMRKNREFSGAADNARLAGKYAGQGIYASREIKTTALLLLDEIEDEEL